ncbi:transcriptional regulator family: C2H2 zinc finger [Paecilomyces variotii]|nr:transcriptional regulator family: C2H2 zinc finger [Paecilomyces variotii]KAJ9279938.1 transcriptional regulator family: C2H2 zinc finger [Paecilomyces variotii]KAJ9288980.1 transcriptional regulator family: C2H2 zinc finger [Paecilomyces variotii]KAJ9314322.1 transcriptional regulator family: C2H2 zinc finger [Paecilomyces variotii]KAJ9342974.1 transcriptional regulator family: C2H2 zinc finger [Paecilomyces variotii]
MGTAIDGLTASQPLTSRRPAAQSLPSFELPPPPSQFPLSSSNQKYHSQSNIHPPNVSVGNLLTPPSNHSGETNNTIHSGAASNTASASQEVPSYSSGYWPGQNSYGYGSATAPSQSWNQGVHALFQPRGYSPLVGSLGRNTAGTPNTSEGMSQPYDINQLPPFQQSLPVSSPTVASPAVQQHQAMAHAMMSAQGTPPSSAPPSQQFTAADPYASKPASTPIFGGSQQAPNAPYPSYGGPSPISHGGLGIHPAGPRMQPGPSQSPTGQPTQFGYNRPPWPSYSLPAMSGPVMTNVHSPNGQMSLMGGMQPGVLPGFNSGQVASMHHMYGGHPSHQGHGQPGPPNDRPFKCDQCPQSFNRNHDLKRHKRIHLSVKPFPCNHCDKSFSRKDALKRHILVKGCGKDTSSEGGSANQAGSVTSSKDEDGAVTRTDSNSDKQSPVLNGHV